MGDHILITKWAPQNDILAHNKTMIFVTHGGLKRRVNLLIRPRDPRVIDKNNSCELQHFFGFFLVFSSHKINLPFQSQRRHLLFRSASDDAVLR